jgi:hypothetical protein
MPRKHVRLITGWRQVKFPRGLSRRWSFPEAAAKAAPRAVSGEAVANDRWESEGGRLVAPVGARPAAHVAKPKIPQ